MAVCLYAKGVYIIICNSQNYQNCSISHQFKTIRIQDGIIVIDQSTIFNYQAKSIMGNTVVYSSLKLHGHTTQLFTICRCVYI